MVTPDRKVRKLMEEYQKTGKLTTAALRADMDPKTARRYVKAGKLPSQMRMGRSWRTRADSFTEHWEEVSGMQSAAPELEAKALFEWLCERYPEAYQEGQVRRFQRRVREWRALEGPAQEVSFPQEHEPGVRLETDFAWMNSLGITILGEAFRHLLCHNVLAYSNWEWATVCRSESLAALKKGLQAALVRLGHVPRENWTDHSTAATHAIGSEREGRRQFNAQYVHLSQTGPQPSERPLKGGQDIGRIEIGPYRPFSWPVFQSTGPKRPNRRQTRPTDREEQTVIHALTSHPRARGSHWAPAPN